MARSFPYPQVAWASAFLALSLLLGLALPSAQGTTLLLSSLPVLLLLASGLVPSLLRLLAFAATQRWWKVMWLLLWLSSINWRVRSTASISDNAIDAAALLRILPVAIVGSVILVGALQTGSAIFSAASSGLLVPLVIFNGVNVLSTVWSIYPSWTLYRSIEYLIDSLALIVIVSTFSHLDDFKRLLDWTWILLGVMMLFVVLNLVLLPSEAIIKMRSVFGFGIASVFPVISRNGVGQISGILFLVALCRLLGGRRDRVGFVALAFAMLALHVLAQTRSALVPTVVALPLILFLFRRYLLLGTSLIALAAIWYFGGVSASIATYFLRGQSSEEVSTLTGRVSYWETALRAWESNPLTGLGAFTGGRFIVGVATDDSDSLSSSHNAYMEVLMGTGLAGLMPLLLLVLGTWVYYVRYFRTRTPPTADPTERMLAVECIAVLVVLTIRSMFSVPIVWHVPLEFFAVLAFALYLHRARLQPELTAHPAPA